jgi:LacI family gluconate utilization system Gnt-I transcriptional repressor
MKATTLSPSQGPRRELRMTDVAIVARVSAMTVSRALRDLASVSPSTRRRVEAAVKQTGYVTNRIAGNLSSRRSNVVGLVVPSLRNSLFAETIQGVADTLGQAYDLMVADSGYSLKGEEAAVLAFLRQRVCGVALHNTTHTMSTRRLLKEAGIPCVETGNLTRDPIDMSVGFSNFAAGYAMTEYLIRRGYRSVGFVSLPVLDNDRAAARRTGYIKALQRHRLPVDGRLILEARSGLRGGGEALVELMNRKPKGVDAVFLTGDVLATGAVLEAHRRGWRVPERVAIAGSDDNELQEIVVPSVTSIRFPRYEIGRRAGGMILDRVTGRAPVPAVLDLGFELMQRDSA